MLRISQNAAVLSDAGPPAGTREHTPESRVVRGHGVFEYPISLHPFVVGRPYRIRRLRRALEHIASHRDRVWITRPRDVCAHVENLPPGVVPGS